MGHRILQPLEHEEHLAVLEFIAEVNERLLKLDERLSALELLIREGLNESYRQGVADSAKARTGHDPKVQT
jgi:hypothetical protein